MYDDSTNAFHHQVTPRPAREIEELVDRRSETSARRGETVKLFVALSRVFFWYVMKKKHHR